MFIAGLLCLPNPWYDLIDPAFVLQIRFAKCGLKILLFFKYLPIKYVIYYGQVLMCYTVLLTIKKIAGSDTMIAIVPIIDHILPNL